MLYITIKRTQCVFDIKAAEDMRAISTRQNIAHVIKSGVLPGLGIFCTMKFFPDILVKHDILSAPFANKIFFVSGIVFFGAVAVAMAIMGTMIVTKIKANRRLLNDHTESIVNGGGQGEEEALTTSSQVSRNRRSSLVTLSLK